MGLYRETIWPRNATFSHAGSLDIVLSEYPDKSHNFINLNFYDVITLKLYNHHYAKPRIHKTLQKLEI